MPQSISNHVALRLKNKSAATILFWVVLNEPSNSMNEGVSNDSISLFCICTAFTLPPTIQPSFTTTYGANVLRVGSWTFSFLRPSLGQAGSFFKDLSLFRYRFFTNIMLRRLTGPNLTGLFWAIFRSKLKVWLSTCLSQLATTWRSDWKIKVLQWYRDIEIYTWMDVLYTLQYVQYGNFNKENAGKSSHQFDLGALCFKTHWSLLWSGDFAQLVRSTLIKCRCEWNAVPRKLRTMPSCWNSAFSWSGPDSTPELLNFRSVMDPNESQSSCSNGLRHSFTTDACSNWHSPVVCTP